MKKSLQSSRLSLFGVCLWLLWGISGAQGWTLTVNNITGGSVTNTAGGYTPVIVTPPGMLQFNSLTAQGMYSQSVPSSIIPMTLTNDFCLTMFKVAGSVAYNAEYVAGEVPDARKLALDGFEYGFIFAAFLAGIWSIKQLWKTFVGGDSSE